MKIWRMNLIDNRSEISRCKDAELKLRICLEKSILGIGWGLVVDCDSWEIYREYAECIYSESKGYSAAVNALEELACGDLVWTQNPVTHERYVAWVTDDKPSMCCHLRGFDLFSCRKAEIFKIDAEQMEQYGLSGTRLSGRKTLERIHEQTTIDATKRLFEALKQGR